MSGPSESNFIVHLILLFIYIYLLFPVQNNWGTFVMYFSIYFAAFSIFCIISSIRQYGGGKKFLHIILGSPLLGGHVIYLLFLLFSSFQVTGVMRSISNLSSTIQLHVIVIYTFIQVENRIYLCISLNYNSITTDYYLQLF